MLRVDFPAYLDIVQPLRIRPFGKPIDESVFEQSEAFNVDEGLVYVAYGGVPGCIPSDGPTGCVLRVEVCTESVANPVFQGMVRGVGAGGCIADPSGRGGKFSIDGVRCEALRVKQCLSNEPLDFPFTQLSLSCLLYTSDAADE